MTKHEGYRIQSMEPVMIPSGAGTYAYGYKVHFVTGGGMRSFVDVPRSDTLDADVHAAVAAEADKINSTMQKQGA